MKITREFAFSAAHHLTDYHGLCERPHGHTYRMAVTVEGKIQKDGLVIDFAVMKEIVKKKVLDKVDHTDLNDFFKNPSAENLAMWVWEQLKGVSKDSGRDVKLVEIKLWEGDNTFVTYDGD